MHQTGRINSADLASGLYFYAESSLMHLRPCLDAALGAAARAAHTRKRFRLIRDVAERKHINAVGMVPIKIAHAVKKFRIR